MKSNFFIYNKYLRRFKFKTEKPNKIAMAEFLVNELLQNILSIVIYSDPNSCKLNKNKKQVGGS